MCSCLSNIDNTAEALVPSSSCASVGSTYGVKIMHKSCVHLICASLFCRLWVELAQVQIYNDTICNLNMLYIEGLC